MSSALVDVFRPGWRTQLETFERVAYEESVLRISRAVAERFPEAIERQGMNPELLRQTTRSAIERGRVYEIVGEADVERFLECMLLLGPNFDKDPELSWAREVLERVDLDGEEKMDLIDEYRIFVLEEPI